MFKRIDLTRLQPRFIDLIHTYMDENNLNQKEVAAAVNMKASVLSNILLSKRNLSANYLLNFIIGGIVMARDINDGKAVDVREKIFWNLCGTAQRNSILEKMAFIEGEGYDVEDVLSGFIQAN